MARFTGKVIKSKVFLPITLSLTIVALAVLAVGFAAKAQAADPNLVYGTWPDNNPSSITTAQLRTDDVGQGFPVLEVKNNFYSGCLFGCATYSWKIWEFQTDHWVSIIDSGSWNANGSLDIACYKTHIRYGYAYKVTFTEGSDGADFNHADEYWIVGHQHAGDCPFYR